MDIQQVDRFEKAKENCLPGILSRLEELQLDVSAFQLRIIAFKDSAVLKSYVRLTNSTFYQLFRCYPLTAYSGTLGPKEKEGDLQIPEGVYQIDRFNPMSKYHLSLGLNYPNAYDKILNRTGSDIFIHGGSNSKGCLAIADAAIEELYVLAKMAQDNQQKEIPVYIFPYEMNAENQERYLASASPVQKVHWQKMKEIYDQLFG